MLNKPGYSASLSAACLFPLPQFLQQFLACWHIGQEADNQAGPLCHRCQGIGEGRGRQPSDRQIAHARPFCRILTLTWAIPTRLTPLPKGTQKEEEKQVPGWDARLVSALGTFARVRTRHTAEGETDHFSVTKGSLRTGVVSLGSVGLSILVCMCVGDWRE